MKLKSGELTMIVGSMFSGKSTELQRQGNRHTLAGRTVAYFKPHKDNRYVQTGISTHDGKTVNAHVVERSKQILKGLEILTTYKGLPQVVLIDEVQFFENDIVEVIEFLLRKGIDVVCSGLDLDRFGEPFGAVPMLLCKAEHIVKLKAVCHDCGEDAWVSCGKFTAEEQTVIGEKDKYIPLCRSCYYRKGNLL